MFSFISNYAILCSDLLKTDSNNATALYVKALCYYYQDIPDRAMQFFHHALRVDPDHSKSRLALKVTVLKFPTHAIVQLVFRKLNCL